MKRIELELTSEQLKKLRPLYKKAEANPHTGFIIAQARDDGILVFAFITPEELQQKIYGAVIEREKYSE
jgi:hypothetical protein